MVTISNRQFERIVKHLRYYERCETNYEHRRQLRVLMKALERKQTKTNEH